MPFGFGFIPAIVNANFSGTNFSATAEYNRAWQIHHRAGVFRLNIKGGGGGGGGKNDLSSATGEAGQDGQIWQHIIFLPPPSRRVSLTVGSGGAGGRAATGFNTASNGTPGFPTYVNFNTTGEISWTAFGGNGGRGAGIGQGTPSYEWQPLPQSNGGYGGAAAPQWGNNNGGPGGFGYANFLRLA